MELPKNITQVGEPGQDLRIYIEDYVVSYMKQLGTRAGEKKVAIALYGKSSREKEPIYYFIYGGHEVSSITDEVKHLSSAQLQETERLRKVHFPDLQFVGYCLVNGEFFEDIMVWEQGICHLVTGYAQFYEKNDAMLEILLSVNPVEGSREVIDDSKYETVRNRNLRRKEELIATEEKRMEETGGSYRFAQFCTVAVFACVCIGGTFLMTRASGIDWKDSVSQIVLDLLAKGEQSSDKFGEESWITAANPEAEGVSVATNPGSEGVTAVASPEIGGRLAAKESDTLEEHTSQKVTEVGTIVTEDALAQVLLEENLRGAENIKQEESQRTEESGLPQSLEELQTEGQSMNHAEGQPVNNAEGQPVNNAEGQPVSNVEGQPVSNAEGQPVNNAEGQPVSNTEGHALNATEEQPSVGVDGQEPIGIGEQDPTESVVQTVAEPVSPRAYEVRKGDTLLGISVREYGTPAYVSEICRLNDIQNPDNIQMGQKILLP